MPKHHIITEVSEPLCCVAGFTTEDRDMCVRCIRMVDDMIHAVRELSKLPGFSELAQKDKRVARAVERAFKHKPTET